jgi:hypothetical protein
MNELADKNFWIWCALTALGSTVVACVALLASGTRDVPLAEGVKSVTKAVEKSPAKIPETAKPAEPSPAKAAEEPKPPRRESAADRFVEQADFDGLQNALAAKLTAAGKRVAAEKAEQELPKLLADESYCTELAQHELIRVTGAKNLAAVAQSPKGKEFLQALLDDRAWIELYLGCGIVPADTDEGLAILRDLWADDGSPAPYRAIATATAIAFSTPPTKANLKSLVQRPEKPLTPLERYRFFKESHQSGELYPVFDHAKPWHLRLLAAAHTDDESLRWLQSRVNLPLDRLGDACWMVQYRGASDFGDTIQGPLFYAPWANQYCHMENIYLHGGVCGSLSTFGAMSAVSHGVPAVTVGQPGHCAYAYWAGPEKRWLGGFGGPDGWPHAWLWKGGFPFIALAEDCFADDAQSLLAQRHSWQARLYGDADRARRDVAFRAALKASPLRYDLWSEYVAARLLEPEVTADDWSALADEVLAAFGTHVQPMCDLLAQFEEQKLLQGKDAEAKTQWFLKVHRTVDAGSTFWSWNMPKDLLQRQIKLSGGDAEARYTLYRQALAIHLGTKHYANQMLEWGIEEVTQKPADAARLVGAVADAVQHAQPPITDELWKDLAGRAVMIAEKAHSVEAFQVAGELGKRFSSAEGKITLDEPAGKLISPQAMLYASSSQWDNPCSHRNVLTRTGGLFHTQSETDPWVIVEFPDPVRISGMLIVNRPGQNAGRTKRLQVFASDDAKTWRPVAKNDDFGEQWKLDLHKKRVQAKYVKLVGPRDKPEHFHLRNILIYEDAKK